LHRISAKIAYLRERIPSEAKAFVMKNIRVFCGNLFPSPLLLKHQMSSQFEGMANLMMDDSGFSSCRMGFVDLCSFP